MLADTNAIVSTLAALSPLLLVATGGAGWLYRHERERREEAEASVSAHKYAAYLGLLEPFFDSMKAKILENGHPGACTRRTEDVFCYVHNRVDAAGAASGARRRPKRKESEHVWS